MNIVAYLVYSTDPPFAKLSLFERMGPSQLVSGPPSRRLLRSLAALLGDSTPEVAGAAARAASVGSHAWPEMSALLANFQLELGPLARFASSATGVGHPPGVDFALRIPSLVARRYGKRTWDEALIEEERADAEAGTSLPRALGAPRLFFSYRWSDNPSSDLVPDETAGLLHMRGYDLVFDRDPRHLDSGRSAEDVLRLMHGCTHFVACITKDSCRYFALDRREPKTALDLEWELAAELSRPPGGLRPMALWFNGEPIPSSAASWPFVDLRKSKADLRELFPACSFEVHVFDASARRTFRSKPMDRHALRAAHLDATARPGAARVEVHDVTPRPQLDALMTRR